MSDEMLFQRDEMESALSDNVQESDEEKYLIFRSGEILYAINTEFVDEILTNVAITRVPMVPEYIAGVINLRGGIVPIVDFRLLLGRYPDAGDICIIKLTIDTTEIGILVDGVDQMTDISRSAILPVPSQNDNKFVNGMCTLPGGTATVMILDAPALVRVQE